MPDTPYPTELLDEHPVIWRIGDRIPHSIRDLRIHRGTALSLGWVKKLRF